MKKCVFKKFDEYAVDFIIENRKTKIELIKLTIKVWSSFGNRLMRFKIVFTYEYCISENALKMKRIKSIIHSATEQRYHFDNSPCQKKVAKQTDDCQSIHNRLFWDWEVIENISRTTAVTYEKFFVNGVAVDNKSV